jgi:hypothetical protein
MVPPGRRLGPALELIDEGKYFTLTAGRQTGKTTSLRWLVGHYREVGTASAIWVDLQIAREEPDPAVAFDAILRCLDWSVETYLPGVGLPAERASYLAAPAAAVERYLQDLSRRCPLPLVVLFDRTARSICRSTWPRGRCSGERTATSRRRAAPIASPDRTSC